MSYPDIALRPLVGERDYHDTLHIDIEQKALDDAHLMNTTVKSFTWDSVDVSVKDKMTKQQKNILDNVSGKVEAGRLGKSTQAFHITSNYRQGRSVP